MQNDNLEPLCVLKDTAGIEAHPVWKAMYYQVVLQGGTLLSEWRFRGLV